MKNLIIKYLFLSYHARILDRDFYFVRAATVIVPVFCIAIALTLLTNLSLIFWAIFAAVILITFPIVKSAWINWATFITGSVMIILAADLGHDWWEPIPIFYFCLGFFVDRTKFIFFNVKYKDLQDPSQQLQYLTTPDGKKPYDETEPTFFLKEQEIKRLRALDEMKFGYNSNVNVVYFLIPVISTILLILLLIIFREMIESFPDRRGF